MDDRGCRGCTAHWLGGSAKGSARPTGYCKITALPAHYLAAQGGETPQGTCEGMPLPLQGTQFELA